jgi:hypothetical protein
MDKGRGCSRNIGIRIIKEGHILEMEKGVTLGRECTLSA